MARNKAKVLLVKLWNAKKALSRDNSDQAIQHLVQFIHHVEILVRQGNLAAEYGDALIQDAEFIILQIEADNQSEVSNITLGVTEIFLPLMNP